MSSGAATGGPAAAAAAAAAWRSPIGCTPAPSGAPDAAAAAAPFRAWCDKERVLWPKCDVAMSAATGRCVVAREAIAEGEVVVEVPDDAVLMVENSPIFERLSEAGMAKPAADPLLEVQGLVVTVMRERAVGAASRWGPYLSFLPGCMDHMPMYWEPSELAELRGTAADDKMTGRVQHPADAPTRVLELFEALVIPFVENDADLAKELLGPRGLPAEGKAGAETARAKLLELYKWSTAAVASYSFILGDDQFQAMCPVWDALNHITGATNVRLHHDPSRGVLQMIATAPIPTGAEVVNCYGRLSNSDLLRGYGYVEATNINEHAQVPAQFLIRTAAAAAAAATSGQQAAANGKGKAASGGDSDEDGSSGSGEDGSDEEEDGSGQSGSEGSQSDDDGEVYDASDSGSESSSDEPDYEVEDDESDDPEQSKQQSKGKQSKGKQSKGKQSKAAKQSEVIAPRLSEATEAMPDWEDRWALAHTLRVLPKSGAFAVFGGPHSGSSGKAGAASSIKEEDGGGSSGVVPREMVGLAAMLLAPVSQCRRLLKIVEAAGRGGNSCNAEREGDEAAAEAAAAADAAVVAAVAKLKLPPAPLLRDTLSRVGRLMLSRYTCSLAEDEQLLSKLNSLPPRLQAAVIARAGEKRCLHAMLQELGESATSDDSLTASAREAIADGVAALAARRRAKAQQDVEEDSEEVGEEEEEEGEESGSEGEEEEEDAGKGAKRRRAEGAEGGGGGKKQARGGAEPSATDKSFSFGFQLGKK